MTTEHQPLTKDSICYVGNAHEKGVISAREVDIQLIEKWLGAVLEK